MNRQDGQVVIVGGGFSGTLLAVNLVRHEGPPVVLIEREADHLARGLAYGAARPDQLLNVRAAGMSAFPDEPGHLVEWLERRDHGGQIFVRRRLYGAYLQELLADAQGAAPDRLQVLTDAAVDAERAGRGYAVRLASGATLRASTLVLATGNLPPAIPGPFRAAGLGAPLFVNDPWREDAAGGLDGANAVLVLGTGLTAVDSILELVDRGFAGRIVALSRRGLLPHAHDPGQAAAPGLTNLPRLRLSKLVRRVRREAVQIGWRSAVDRLRPVTQGLWARSDLATRARFLCHLRAYWDVHRHRLAPEIADRVAALIASGTLQISAGKLLSVTEQDGRVRLAWRVRRDERVETVEVDRVINCTGIDADLSRSAEPLLTALAAKGLIRPDALGLGIDTDAHGRVRDANGVAHRHLLGMGPTTRGAFWEVTAVPDIRRQAWMLGRQLSNAHWVGGEGL